MLEVPASGGLRISLPAAHVHEVLHYFVGTRYFAELGYTGLYDAVVVADREDARRFVRPRQPMRDLSTNTTLPRRDRFDAARERVRAAFTPGRWTAFKADVGALRNAAGPDVWKTATLDHGYNGTPLVTALLGGVAALPWLSAEALSWILPFADPLLVAALGGGIWAVAGATPALSFLFFVFANPFNDHSFIGGSYLRYGYLLALAGAVVALRRRAHATCGALLAVAGGLRIFPLALYAALALRDLVGGAAGSRLREGRRLHVAFALALLAIVAGTSLLTTPDGRNPWLAFADNIRLHAGTPGINQAHLGVALAYDADTEALHDAHGDYWSAGRARMLEQRAWPTRAVAALGLGFAFLALRRVGRRAALVPGLLAVYCAFPMTHYYWASLAIVPLALPDHRRIHAALLALFAAFALSAAPGVLEGRRDLQFALESIWLGAFLVYATWEVWRRPGDAALTHAAP